MEKVFCPRHGIEIGEAYPLSWGPMRRECPRCSEGSGCLVEWNFITGGSGTWTVQSNYYQYLTFAGTSQEDDDYWNLLPPFIKRLKRIYGLVSGIEPTAYAFTSPGISFSGFAIDGKYPKPIFVSMTHFRENGNLLIYMCCPLFRDKNALKKEIEAIMGSPIILLEPNPQILPNKQ